MRAIVLINPSSTVALILLVIGLQTGSLGYEQVSEVRLSATTSRDDSGLFSAKESRIGNSMEAGSINETRDTRTAPHLMELARDAKTNPADDKRGGSLRATHLPRFKSITVSRLMKMRQRRRVETQEIKETKQHHMELSQKIRRFEEDFANMDMGHFRNDKLKNHVSNWRLTAGVQYSRKVNQLRAHGRYRSLLGEEGLPREVFDMIYGKVVTDYLTAFGDVVRTSIDYRAKGVEDPARLMVARWSDLMLDFFFDLKKRGMLPSLLRSAGERSFETGKFVASYLLGKFSPFDVTSTYLNWDLRTSILEDTNIHKLKELSHQFDEATWKEIEFQFLEARLQHELAAGTLPQGFEPIMKGFIQGGRLPDGGSEMGSLFQDIISYIPKAELTGEEKQANERLVHFKVLYDMLRFIYRYNSHPEQIISRLEGQQSLLQLRTFEECIRFISSLNHFGYEVSKLWLLNLRHKDSLLEHLGQHFLKSVCAGTTRQQLKLPDKIREKLMGSHYLTDAPKQPQESPPSSFGKPLQDTSEENDAALLWAVFADRGDLDKLLIGKYLYVYFFPQGREVATRIKQETKAQHMRYLIQAYKLKQISSPPVPPSTAFLDLIESLISAAIHHAKKSAKFLAHTIKPYQQAFELDKIQMALLLHFS